MSAIPGTYTVYDRRQPVLTGFATNDEALAAARTYRAEHPESSPLTFLAR